MNEETVEEVLLRALERAIRNMHVVASSPVCRVHNVIQLRDAIGQAEEALATADHLRQQVRQQGGTGNKGDAA
jgi:hypothetical protein